MAIVDFILARVTDDELVVRRVLERQSASPAWRFTAEDEPNQIWDPWRVESACIATRLLAKAHRNVGPILHEMPGADPKLLAATCRTCRDDDGEPVMWPCYTLRVLAAQWSHHPDYRPEWRADKLTDPHPRGDDRR